MSHDADLVLLTTAATAMEAEWVVGALKGYGIRSVVFGTALADEFAMSQRALGLRGGVQVMVREDDLERARRALRDIEATRASPEELEAAWRETIDDRPDGDACETTDVSDVRPDE